MKNSKFHRRGASLTDLENVVITGFYALKLQNIN